MKWSCFRVKMYGYSEWAGLFRGSAFLLFEILLLNDFACRETRLHNANWFNRMIALGSIQRYAV